MKIKNIFAGMRALAFALPLALSLAFGAHFALAQNSTDTTNTGADALGLGGLTPEGRWESVWKDARYDVTLCGDGTQLCVKLVWINPRDLNDRNIQYLNEFVVFEGNRFRPAQWKGDINVYGTVYGGTVKLLAYDRVNVTGCIFILCESFELYRKRNPDGSRYRRQVAESDS